MLFIFFFFFQAEDGIRDLTVTGVQTCALPISSRNAIRSKWSARKPPARAARPRFRSPSLRRWKRLNGRPSRQPSITLRETSLMLPARSASAAKPSTASRNSTTVAREIRHPEHGFAIVQRRNIHRTDPKMGYEDYRRDNGDNISTRLTYLLIGGGIGE